MTAIRRWLSPAAARRMASDAGPPDSWQGASLVAAVFASAIVASLPGAGLVLPAALGLAIVTLPAIVDVTGWRIRLGMAWLAAEQRRRGWAGIPRSVAAADRWLAEHGDAEPRLRASILMTAGRAAEARPLIESILAETAEDRAIVARMLAAIDGVERGRIEPGLAIEAIDALPADQRRYHRLSLAWSIAWVESANRRPWRQAFAGASRGVARDEIPRTWLVLLSLQQLLLPLCVAAVLGFWALIILSR